MSDEQNNNALDAWVDGFDEAEALAMAKQLGGKQSKRGTALAFVKGHTEVQIREAWDAVIAARRAGVDGVPMLALEYEKPLSFFYNKQYHLRPGRNVLPKPVAEHISKWLRDNREFHSLGPV